MENNRITITPSPHVLHSDTTQTIMRDVLIALSPALVLSVYIFGFRALLVEFICVATAVLSEWIFELICKRPITVADFSAAVTGLLLAFNLPVSIPLWQAAFGSAVAIVIVKQFFGGIGKNFANPAITARIIMLLAFSGTMASWTEPFTDAVASATPLIATGDAAPSYLNLFLGFCSGSLGETSAVALLIGGIYLIVRKVISWHTPVAFIGTVFLFSWALGCDPVYQILAGGLVLGAVFMATDYSSTPTSFWGRIIFGVGCGLVTVLIRVYGNYPEGVSFSILLMNILTPFINSATRRKAFGGVKVK